MTARFGRIFGTMGLMGLTASQARRAGLIAGASALGAAALSGVANVVMATYFARRVVTPEVHRPDDTVVLAVTDTTITLRATINTVLPGRYGLWFGGTEAHARIGEILHHDVEARTVRRELLGVDFGEIGPGTARWNGYFYVGGPRVAFGLETIDLTLVSDVGDLPTWLVPPAPEQRDDRKWAVLVHGRSAPRDEVLRAVPVLHELGYHVLIPSYRNDPEAPASPDGRYTLGLSEWHDIEVALRHAIDAGAQDLLLAGWSMGGAIVLQTLDKSLYSHHVTDVLLDAPVIDWIDVLEHQAHVNRIPRIVERLARTILRERTAHALVGIAQPLDLAQANWVARADELRHRMLIIHSDEDDFVPNGPSRELARRRPDLVTFVPWSIARHVREWNVDAERWNRVVRQFLVRQKAPAPA